MIRRKTSLPAVPQTSAQIPALATSALASAPPAQPRQSFGKTFFVSFFGGAIILGGLYGFGGKIYNFIMAWQGDYDARFAIIPVAMYFCVALGFACIFAWAVLHGMLTDIEGPKYRMLENERDLEREEERERLQKRGGGRWA
jgi:nitrogen fixation-related uncharacterized protein